MIIDPCLHMQWAHGRLLYMYLPTWYRSVEAYVDLNTVIDGSTGTLSCGTDSCVALRTNAPLRTCLFCKSYVWYLDPLCIYPTPHLHPLCGRAFFTCTRTCIRRVAIESWAGQRMNNLIYRCRSCWLTARWLSSASQHVLAVSYQYQKLAG